MKLSNAPQYRLQTQNNITNNKSNVTKSVGQNEMQIISAPLYSGVYTNSYLINFGAMKKNQFKSFDRAVVDTFKTPIEKFSNIDDFTKWCKSKIESISQNLPKTRSEDAGTQRRAIFEEWKKYVTEENEVYTPAMGLLILSAITQGLKPNTDKLPPSLNKGALANSIEQYEAEMQKGKKPTEISLKKIYNTELQATILGEYSDKVAPEDFTGWVEIPSKINDEANFDKNVEKLKALSHPNWCTKSLNAEPYLSDGDFHIYLEKGTPQLGVRFEEDKILEIQGKENDGDIPLDYIEVLKNHIAERKLDDSEVEYNIVEAEIRKEEIEEFLQAFMKKYNKRPEDFGVKTLRAFGLRIEEYTPTNQNVEDTSKKYAIDSVNWNNGHLGSQSFISYENCGLENPDKVEPFTMNELGLNSMPILKDVRKIRYSADFSSDLSWNFPNLEEVGKNLCILGNTKNIRNLKSIGGDLIFSEEKYEEIKKIIQAGNLEHIGGEILYDNDAPIEKEKEKELRTLMEQNKIRNQQK